GLLRALAAACVHPARLLEPRVVAVAVLRGLPVGVADEAGEPGLGERPGGTVAFGAEGVGALLLDGAAADAAEEAARRRDRRLHGRGRVAAGAGGRGHRGLLAVGGCLPLSGEAPYGPGGAAGQGRRGVVRGWEGSRAAEPVAHGRRSLTRGSGPTFR